MASPCLFAPRPLKRSGRSELELQSEAIWQFTYQAATLLRRGLSHLSLVETLLETLLERLSTCLVYDDLVAVAVSRTSRTAVHESDQGDQVVGQRACVYSADHFHFELAVSGRSVGRRGRTAEKRTLTMKQSDLIR